MIVEWSTPHGGESRGEVLAWVVLDHSPHAIVQVGDKVKPVAVYLLRVVDPAPTQA